jgi:hypothetical protein
MDSFRFELEWTKKDLSSKNYEIECMQKRIKFNLISER